MIAVAPPVLDPADVYRTAVLDQVWRLIGLIDRNPHSATRGSFSRAHWGWKFVDFAYPRLQEGVYALVRLHELDDSRNPVFAAPAAAQWIEWGFAYWASRQHRNGAYDEAYPFEQCLAATAFTGFYLGRAFLRWEARLPSGLRARLVEAFARAGRWLCCHDETHGVLSNHLAAAAAALAVIERITGEAACAARARALVDRILAHQDAEGWLREYEGADIGYGTHGLFYLADYWRTTGERRVLEACDRAAAFLQYFVHPDGTIGGEYGSRGTEFYYPAGFEMLAGESPACAAIAEGLRPAVAARRVAGVWGVDEFNFMPMLNNLLFAMDAATERAAPPLPHQGEPFRRHFAAAGFWVVNEPAYYAVIGLGKGGTVSVFDKARGRLAARHAGLVLEDRGRAFTSQDLVTPRAVWDAGGAAVTLEVSWKRLRTTVFSPWLFLAFRLFTITLGRIPAVSRAVKGALVYVLIRRRRRPAFRHRRALALAADGVEVRDELAALPAGATVRAVEAFTAMHMGSALYPDIRVASLSGTEPAWTVGANGRLSLAGRLAVSGASWTESG